MSKRKQMRRGNDALYSIDEWCALADIGVSTMRRWLRQTKQPVMKVHVGPNDPALKGLTWKPRILYYDSDLTRVLFEHR